MEGNKVLVCSRFTEYDIFLFKSGKHFRLYNHMGCHELEFEGKKGLYFAVYAPAARAVELIGNFNNWSGSDYKLFVRWDGSGIWEGFVPGLRIGEIYKYRIYSNYDALVREKSDPFSYYFEIPPKTASISRKLDYDWMDKDWMKGRGKFDPYNSPVSIYEVHLGSWKKKNNGKDSLNYLELADELLDYVCDMGYTHVELLPVTEHPYYPSWGYLSTGFFAPTSRFGPPEDFMHFVDRFHQRGIGILLDWVPAHFPADRPFLADFDGSCVYEHPNPKKGFHPDWNSLIFNYERPEIRSFLISSAHFWLDVYHLDGLRVDAVASMLYLDYSRKEGEWDPNEYGGNENLAAIQFLKELNSSCYGNFPGVIMMAEESTAFPGITKKVEDGGLGFGFKWMMGWMNDTLRFMEKEPLYRQFHHHELTFSMVYAYSESFVLPLSHDEVVHGKKPIVYKMPGDDWQKFANTRLLYSYMYTHPGHKLLFMGNDIAQSSEWNLDTGVVWDLLKYDSHKGLQTLIKDLNRLIRSEASFHKKNFSPEGFEWIEHADHSNSVISFVRSGGPKSLVVVCNFNNKVYENYELGVPSGSKWREIFNSDAKKYWGSGVVNKMAINASHKELHKKKYSIKLNVPPLGVTVLKSVSK